MSHHAHWQNNLCDVHCMAGPRHHSSDKVLFKELQHTEGSSLARCKACNALKKYWAQGSHVYEAASAEAAMLLTRHGAIAEGSTTPLPQSLLGRLMACSSAATRMQAPKPLFVTCSPPGRLLTYTFQQTGPLASLCTSGPLR